MDEITLGPEATKLTMMAGARRNEMEIRPVPTKIRQQQQQHPPMSLANAPVVLPYVFSDIRPKN